MPLTTLVDERSGALDAQPADGVTRVKITMNTRLGWHQVSMLELDDPVLDERLHRLAIADWKRFFEWRTIIVTATDIITGRIIEVVRGQALPPCPQCGFTR